jgi:predicted  nucleic acid-binding Zn-ribbon protein
MRTYEIFATRCLFVMTISGLGTLATVFQIRMSIDHVYDDLKRKNDDLVNLEIAVAELKDQLEAGIIEIIRMRDACEKRGSNGIESVVIHKSDLK